MFDKKGERGTGAPTEGKHHFEWKPAQVFVCHASDINLLTINRKGSGYSGQQWTK